MTLPSYLYRATLVRVIDGDTIEAKVDLGFYFSVVQRFRLAGYNAPEIHGPEAALGAIARRDLGVILDHEPLTIESTKGDLFGRWLAEVQVSGLDLVTLLVQRGYGVRWDGKGKRPAPFLTWPRYPMLGEGTP